MDQRLIKSDSYPALTRALVTWLVGVAPILTWEDRDVIRIARRAPTSSPLRCGDKNRGRRRHRDRAGAAAAVNRGIPILRAGHPTVDAIAEHLLQSERGVAFAMFRPWPGTSPAEVAFRADFLVAASFPQDSSSGGCAWRAAMGRCKYCGMSHHLIVEKVVMAPSGEEATDRQLLQPYAPKAATRI